MEFDFSFNAVPTIDMVLYFRVEMKEDGDGDWILEIRYWSWISNVRDDRFAGVGEV